MKGMAYMSNKSKSAYIWSDRKRILGLPITFTKYYLSDDRLFMEKGLLNMRQDENVLTAYAI